MTRARRWRGALLWAAATALMLTAAVHQRLTGPSHPLRGEVTLAGDPYAFRLPRSGWTDAPVRVALPSPGPEASGTLVFRRYPTDDPFTARPLEPEDGELAARLPVQPPAGKVEYRVEVRSAGDTLRIPAAGADEPTVILRYRGPVPTALLVAHVAAMFFTVLVGMRAGLGALFHPEGVRRLAVVTLAGMTVGGLVLGPIVQKYAFGAFWTGFPWGYDLTDNKLLVMWLVWAIAVAVIGREPARRRTAGRVAVATAAVVMTVVYLIPHSMRGSELDYDALEAGVPETEAVGTGR